MKKSCSTEELKGTFPLIDGVQYLRTHQGFHPPCRWAQRAMKFEVMKRCQNQFDPSTDLLSLGKIIVEIRKASNVRSILFNSGQSSSNPSNHWYEDSVHQSRYLSMDFADQVVEASGITDLVLFGPEWKSSGGTRLDLGRKSNKLIDTKAPIDQVTYVEDDNAPYAKFTFYHRSEGEQTSYHLESNNI